MNTSKFKRLNTNKSIKNLIGNIKSSENLPLSLPKTPESIYRYEKI